MVRRSVIRLIGAGLGLLVLGAAWYFVAPRQLGGSATYAIIVGSSMEPTIERGDLVVAREADRYEVGDVAAYGSANLGAVVLHRIVGRSGDRFLFKGDANDFVDPERPAEKDLVGKRWAQLPFAGAALQWLREPKNAAVLAAVAALLVLGGGAGMHGRRRRRGRKETGRDAGPRAVRSGALRLWARAVLGLFGAAALAFALLGLAAFTRPATTIRPAAELYRQSGAFSYAAVAPKSPVYDRSELATGDALFVAVVREVSLAFEYRFESAVAHRVFGTIRLTAELSDGNGWRRTLELAPPAPFTGDRAVVTGRLDLRELERLTERFEEITETARDTYLLTVTPHVELEGTVGERSLHEGFAPSALLMLDPSRFQVAPEGMLGGRQNDLTPMRATQGRERVRPAAVSLLGRRVSVETARTTAVVGGLAAVVAALAVGLVESRRRGRDEPGLIAARYGELLIPVTAVERTRAESAVTVATMEALARLAERYGRMILHEESSGLHAYAVEDDGVVYRYEARDGLCSAGVRAGALERRLAGTP